MTNGKCHCLHFQELLANGLSESDVAGHKVELFWVIRSFERAENQEDSAFQPRAAS